MRSHPFPYSDIVKVDGVALPASTGWSSLAPHLTLARRQRILEVAAGRNFSFATVLEHVHDEGISHNRIEGPIDHKVSANFNQF